LARDGLARLGGRGGGEAAPLGREGERRRDVLERKARLRRVHLEPPRESLLEREREEAVRGEREEERRRAAETALEEREAARVRDVRLRNEHAVERRRDRAERLELDG
jgi:hypothetical protein